MYRIILNFPSCRPLAGWQCLPGLPAYLGIYNEYSMAPVSRHKLIQRPYFILVTPIRGALNLEEGEKKKKKKGVINQLVRLF